MSSITSRASCVKKRITQRISTLPSRMLSQVYLHSTLSSSIKDTFIANLTSSLSISHERITTLKEMKPL